MTTYDPKKQPQQAEEFLRELFEYEDCDSCGGGAKDHTAAVGPFSKLIAICKR